MTMSDSQLYYYNGNQLLQLDLTATADYFINDQKDVISRLTPYPSNLVFELPRGHTTTAVFFLNKTISVLTRGPNKYSFNTVPLYVL